MAGFYDELAPFYHLIFEDWDASISRQAETLSGLIREHWGDDIRSVIDVACGIGTQAIGLAQSGFRVTASDLSAAAVARARQESEARGLVIDYSVCDMRHCRDHHRRKFDLVMACDNSLPHLLTDAEILAALRQMNGCLRPGGGILLTVRDYDREPRGRGIFKPYGVRESNGMRWVLFQVWDFDGEHYDLSLYFVQDDGGSKATTTRILRTRYYAIGTDRLMELMRQADFVNLQRHDQEFYQPILTGKRADCA